MKRRWALLLLSGVLAGAAPAQAPLPFKIGKDTTVITEPLKADGTPDFVAGLNRMYGEGVTAENNALVPLLAVRGVEAVDGRVREEFLRRLGVQPDRVPSAPTFQTYPSFLVGGQLTEQAFARQYADADVHLWTAQQYPDLARYIAAQSAALDHLVEASRRARCFAPFVSTDGTCAGLELFSYSGMGAAGRAMAARIRLRAASGEMDEALADADSLRRLARLLPAAGGNVPILLGGSFENRAVDALSAIIIAAAPTPAQFDILARVSEMPPLSQVLYTDSLGDFGAREDFCQFAAGKRDDLIRRMTAGGMNARNAAELRGYLGSVDVASIDWNLALATFNTLLEKERMDLESTPIDQLGHYEEMLRDRDASWESDLKQHNNRFTKDPGESREAYTVRFVHGWMSHGSRVTFVSYERHRREVNFRASLLPFLVLAAKAHASTGKWPQTAEEVAALSPGKPLPGDPYAGNAPLRYELRDGRPRLFSVGADHRAGTQDDVAVGEFVPAAPGGAPAGLP